MDHSQLAWARFKHVVSVQGSKAEGQGKARVFVGWRTGKVGGTHLWATECAQLRQHALLLHLVEQRHVQRDVEGRRKLHLLPQGQKGRQAS